MPVLLWFIVTRSGNKANWAEVSLSRTTLFYTAIVVVFIRGFFDHAWDVFSSEFAFPAVFLVQVLLSGANAIIITELVRITLSSGPTWTARKHNWVLTSFWAGFFVLKILFVLSGRGSFSLIYQWTDSNGAVNYSDAKPKIGNVKVIRLQEPVLVKTISTSNASQTRIISWEVTEHHDSYINLAVKYHYDGRFKDSNIWLSAGTLDNGGRSMNYSVRPSKMKIGTGIANIRLGVSTRVPKRHCTNKIVFSMYGKHIPIFHEATVNFSKCWSNIFAQLRSSN